MRKTNFREIKEIRDIRETLNRYGKSTYESFVMPEGNDYEEEYDGGYQEGGDMPQEMGDEQSPMFDSEVREAIVKIRKISIAIIAKLADNPTSESYTFMKRVLDMSDKAMESITKNGEDVK